MSAVKETTRPVRERLRDFVQLHPGATAADAARALGVSRQVVSRIAKEEKLELAKYRTEPEHVGALREELGSRPTPRPLTGGTVIDDYDMIRAAVFRVAADLSRRGYDVFLPSGTSRAGDVIALDPVTGTREVIAVRNSRTRARVRYDDASDRLSDRLAFAIGDLPVEYQPLFPDDATRMLRGTVPARQRKP